MGAPTSNLASDLGGREMAPGENMPADQVAAADSMRDSAVQGYQAEQMDYGKQAFDMVAGHLTQTSQIGMAGVAVNQAKASAKGSSVMQKMTGEQGEDDGLPKGPGFNYMNHLWNRGKAGAVMKSRENHEKTRDDTNIYTDQMEALKTALAVAGVYSDKNPGGLPIDLAAAKKVWFGDEQVGGIDEAEWRSKVEMGDSTIDPKRIRKFANYDGSMTWEVLNHDKTVMSRFTMGQYGGVNIFAQGGYSKFADLLDKVKSKVGPTNVGSFEGARKGSLGGGNI